MTWRSTLCAAGLLTGILVLPSCDKFLEGYNRGKKQQEQKQEALKEIETNRKEYANSLEMKEDGLQLNHEAAEKYQQNIKAAAEKMGGKLGEAIKASSELQAEINKRAKVLDAESEKFPEMLDWASLHKNQDYAERKSYLNGYKNLNKEMLAYFEGHGARLEKRLDEIGFNGPERESFMKGVNQKKGPTLQMVRIIRNSEIEALESTERLTDLLERNKGKWKVNEEGAVLFEDESQVEPFQAEFNKLQAAGQKQLDAQKKFMEMMKK